MKLFMVVALAVAAVNCATINLAKKHDYPSGRIINGHEAMKGEAPYIVSLQAPNHFCAGSIIAVNWVLTAAHCMVFDSFDVVAGLHSRNNEADVQIRKVESKKFQIVHEKYGGEVGPSDIALIYIAQAFDLNALTRDGAAPVTKIALPSGRFEQTGRGKLFGWGLVNSGELPNVLQTLDADIISFEACIAVVPLGANMDRGNICSYTPGKTDGACNGDSGGPLMRYTTDGPELVGIVSWGYTPCVDQEKPSVYTMTSYFIPWIYEKMNNFQVPTV